VSNRHERQETRSEAQPDDRWCKFTYEEIIAHDKTNLGIFWLKDDSLPDPDELAEEIIENLEAGLASFREIWGEPPTIPEL
jgi:type I restriction enzyme M protein